MIYGGAGGGYNHYMNMLPGAPGGFLVKPDKSMEEIDPRNNSTIKSKLQGYGANLHDCTPANVLNADFTADATTIDVGGTVNFTDASADGGSPITSWEWTFQNGTPATFNGQNPPAITFSVQGSQTVTLKVTNANGDDTETKTAYINVGVVIYCDAASKNDLTTSSSAEYISNVKIENIDKTSESAFYSDFTADVVNLKIGTASDITVTSAPDTYNNEQVLIWIDWNVDGDFNDAGENVFTSAIGTTPFSSSITPPANAHIGETRMRIRLHGTGAGFNGNDTPCGDSDWGEVEDYTVDVAADSPQSINNVNNNTLSIYPNPNNGLFKIVSTSNDNNIIITNISGQVIYNSSSNNYVNTIDLSTEKQGVYFVKLVNTFGTSTQKIIIK